MNRIPFDITELENSKESTGFMGMVIKTYETPITPKENYRLIYERKLPLWIPIPGDLRFFIPRVDPDNVARCFIFEANMLQPEEMVGGPDKFGIEWTYVPVAGGSMVKPGNPILEDANDWKAIIKFPDIETWDWEGSKASNADYVNTDKLISFTILSGFFERLISFMDFENAVVALIDDDQKAAVHELFSALTDLYIKIIDKYIECFPVDQLQFHDDWGSQRAPFFSLDTAREMIVPYLKRLTDHCHANGIFFDLHSCGKNDLLVPAYIEAGVDSWSGQNLNDKQTLYEKYSDKIILGIESELPWIPGVTPEPEAAIAAAKRYVEKYGSNYAKKPVILSGFGLSSEFLDTFYEESRRLLNP